MDQLNPQELDDYVVESDQVADETLRYMTLLGTPQDEWTQTEQETVKKYLEGLMGRQNLKIKQIKEEKRRALEDYEDHLHELRKDKSEIEKDRNSLWNKVKEHEALKKLAKMKEEDEESNTWQNSKFKGPDLTKPPPPTYQGKYYEDDESDNNYRESHRKEKLGAGSRFDRKEQRPDRNMTPTLGQEDSTPKYLQRFMSNSYQLHDGARPKFERDDALNNLRRMDIDLFKDHWQDEVTDRIQKLETNMKQTTSDMLFRSESGGHFQDHFIKPPPNGRHNRLSAFGEKVWKIVTDRIKYNGPRDKTISVRDLLRKVVAFAEEAEISHTLFLELLERLSPSGELHDLIELYMENEGSLEDFFIVVQSGLDDRESPLSIKNETTRMISTMQHQPLAMTLLTFQRLAMKQHRMDSPNFKMSSTISTATHSMESYCNNFYDNAVVRQAIGAHANTVDRMLEIGKIRSLPSLVTVALLHQTLLKYFDQTTPTHQTPVPMWVLENVVQKRNPQERERTARPRIKGPPQRRYLGQPMEAVHEVQEVRTRSDNGILEFIEMDDPNYFEASAQEAHRDREAAEVKEVNQRPYDNINSQGQVIDWSLEVQEQENEEIAQLYGDHKSPQPRQENLGARPKAFATQPQGRGVQPNPGGFPAQQQGRGVPPPQRGQRNVPEACFLCNARGVDMHFARDCQYFPGEQIMFKEPPQKCCGGYHSPRADCPRAAHLRKNQGRS
jgi:hypothetical protein